MIISIIIIIISSSSSSNHNNNNIIIIVTTSADRGETTPRTGRREVKQQNKQHSNITITN